MFDKNFTCCFTGHRDILPQHEKQLPRALKKTLRELIERGYHTFVAGGALGFDTIAAEVVLKLKKKYPHIKLIVVAPFAGQSSEWDLSSQLKYERIREYADDYICLSAGYTPTCMKKRNLYLVEMSDVCISYCLRERSGSGQTVNFAKEHGLEIIDITELLK